MTMEREIQEAASMDCLERVLFPALEARLDRAFPVYGFRRDAQGRWIATRRPQSLPHALRTSPRLYGERRGIRGLDAAESFLPWLWHEVQDRQARHTPAAFGQALDRLARASGIPLPDDLLRDAAFARRQRILDLRESVWASLRAIAIKHVGEHTLERLTKLGFSEQTLRDGVHPLGLYPGPASGTYPGAQTVRNRMSELGYTEKELASIGVLAPGLDDRLVLGLRDEFGTLHDLYVVPQDDGGPSGPLTPANSTAATRTPRIYGLDVAIMAKGGPEDLLIVADPMTAASLQARGATRVVGLVGDRFDGRVFDDLACAGVRGVRFLLRDAEEQLRTVLAELPEDQRRRLRMRTLPSGHEIPSPLGKHVAKIGAHEFELELRSFPWRDPRTEEALPDSEPELLVTPDVGTNGQESPLPAAAASEPTNAAVEQASLLTRPDVVAPRRSPQIRPAAPRRGVRQPRQSGTSVHGDASAHVRASAGWKRVEKAESERDSVAAGFASSDSVGDRTVPRTVLPDMATRTAMVSGLFGGLELDWDLVIEGPDRTLLRAVAANLARDAAKVTDSFVWLTEHAHLVPRPASRDGAEANRISVSTSSEGASCVVVDVGVSRWATLDRELATTRALWIVESDADAEDQDRVFAPRVATRLIVRPFAPHDLARTFSCSEDDPRLEDHRARLSQEGRRFFFVELRRCTDAEARVFGMTWTCDEAHGVTVAAGVSPYRF
ncbi:MAG: hypothetical protein KDC95_07225 [Planctomycetes bacterium]|nr:hypothetical protein [Planctomycetota bacterium]